MIDIKNVENKFYEYVKNYDPENPRVKLKISHIARVADNSKYLAETLNLSQEEISLAQAIGFFHDIGRFEQVRIADTFSDKESGINHGEMSVKVLFENDFIREFIPENTYDNIIKKAVLNHNKSHIDSDLTEKELLFSKIIRDADKLDILEHVTSPENSMSAIFWYDNFDVDKINEELIQELKSGDHKLDYSKIKNDGDVILIFYAYIFDLYFKETLRLVTNKKCLDLFTKRVLETFKSPTIHTQVQDVLDYCHKYFKSAL